MPHSQSNLISLATLLESAEARHSALPPAPPPPPSRPDDSGMIDILAMQRRAQEERASAELFATRTPVPMVTTVRSVRTDPDVVAKEGRAARKMMLLVGAVASGVALAVVAIGVGLSGHADPPAEAPVVAAAPVLPPPSPVVVAAPAPPPPLAVEPITPAKTEPVAATAHESAKPKHKKHKAKAGGPKLTKVTSSGVTS